MRMDVGGIQVEGWWGGFPHLKKNAVTDQRVHHYRNFWTIHFSLSTKFIPWVVWVDEGGGGVV